MDVQNQCRKNENQGKVNQVYFKTKKGKKKYQRLHTIVTDANGVSTSKVKVKYNKKKKTLTVTPSKKWWNSKKRKFQDGDAEPVI